MVVLKLKLKEWYNWVVASEPKPMKREFSKAFSNVKIGA